MKIAFYAQSCIPIHARSLEERPLGGTETGLIHVAQILKARGHDVIVFTSMRNPPSASGTALFVHFDEAANYQPFDSFIAVQDWKSAFFNLSAAQYFYWTGDGPEIFANWGIGDRRVETRFRAFFCASNWQAESLASSSGLNPKKLSVIGNGVDLSHFDGSEARFSHRLIHTSAPYRGLELMREIFPKVRSSFPDAELHVFSGMQVYDTSRPFENSLDQTGRALLAELGKISGIQIHQNIPQKALAREYMRASVFAYPNMVNETFCITAIEAQAAGTPVVSTARAGLNESVGEAGILIDPTLPVPQYVDAFVGAISRIWGDEVLWKRLSGLGQARIQSRFQWSTVAERLEAKLAPG